MDNDINREVNIEQVEFNVDIDNIEYSIEINPRDTFAIELNEQGPQGARGYTGNGISSYELTSTVGLTDTYTITFTDGNTTTVNVTNGRGIASITGPVSVGNVDTYTINYNDSTTSTFTVTNGIDGVNPTVTVGTTTTGNPGTNASVINTGTAQDIVLDFTIPRGDKGETGEDGADGFSPIATVSKVGDTATISITDINGTTTATISDGTDGQDGTAATIAVGTVTTGLPTDPASVTNVGTANAAIFDFTIPKGDTGDTGATGNGIASITKTGTVGLVDTYTILYTDGTSTTFTVTNGQNGTGSVADVLVNGTSVLDGQDAKILIKTINSNSITGSGNLDVGTVTSVNNVSPVSGNVTISIPSDTSDLTNGAGYITGITSGDVTTALGYTPYNSTNPNGYISGITSGDVTTALGYTPLSNSTKYGADLSYSSNTLQLLDQDGNNLGNSVTIQSSPDIDGITITKNIDDELQTIAVIDQNNTSNGIKTWTGTRVEYDAIVTKDANTLYNITDDTNFALTILDALYPVGAIYIGTCNACPLQALGIGTWQLIAADRVLQGVGSGTTVGSNVAAGLPNITGTIASWWGNFQPQVCTGAFVGGSAKVNAAGNGSNSGADQVYFDASGSNSIYGKSTTVQPPAYIVNIWERVS